MTPVKTKQAYREYLKSEHWDKLRSAVIERDGNRCTRCPSTRCLQAHHLIYRVRWEDSIPQDLITLCHSCHRKEHGLDKTARKPIKSRRNTAQEPPSRHIIEAGTIGPRHFARLKDVDRARSLLQISKPEYNFWRSILKREKKARNVERVKNQPAPQPKPKKKKEVRWWPGMYEGMVPGQLR